MLNSGVAPATSREDHTQDNAHHPDSFYGGIEGKTGQF